MSMLLPDGTTATIDAENSSVLGPKFAKVFFSNLPVEWSELYELKQRDGMQEIYQPISWDELKAAVPKFTNNKAPGLNKVPSNSFKALNNENLTHFLDFFNKYCLVKLILVSGTKVKSCQYQKLETYTIPKNGAESP